MPMSQKIFLASGNRHKREEMQRLLPAWTIMLPLDEGIAFAPEESGNSFIENCLIKARDLWRVVKLPVLADDSGLCVDALNGAPGIYSARYAGKGRLSSEGAALAPSDQHRLLLQEVAEAAGDAVDGYSCRFVCALVLYTGNERFFAVQETMEGHLVKTLADTAGTGGFGYDPLVIPAGYNKTVAELTPAEKDALSHRGKACRALMKLL
jgi:XTP/dITP diphosphohydrolase